MGIGAAAVLVGAVLLVLGGSGRLPLPLAVLGGLLVALGLALTVAAVLAFGRLAQTVELGAEAVTVRRRRGTVTLAWSDISKVLLDGPRLILLPAAEQNEPVQVLNPGGAAEATFTSLTEAVRERLDAHRGYRPLE
jgi:hypothetical protein